VYLNLGVVAMALFIYVLRHSTLLRKWQMANGKRLLTDFRAGMACGSTGVSFENHESSLKLGGRIFVRQHWRLL
jgi:hypothetical protein